MTGKVPKWFKDVLREQVLNTMRQDKDDEGEVMVQVGGGDSISPGIPPKCGP